MPDEPHGGILDRSLFQETIRQSFSEQLDLLEQLVNYGTNLIPRSFDSSKKQIPETIALLSFLKHGVTSIDAIHILAAKGATLSCFPHIRSLFEIELYLKWLFEEDYERRATAYFVWNLRKERYWSLCYLQGSPEQAAHEQHMRGSLGEHVTMHASQEEITKAIDHETRRLNMPELSEVNAMFEKSVKSSGRDVEWYRPFGVTSIRDMAIKLGMEGMYKVFYASYSQATHGLSLGHQVHFDAPKGEIIFDHIRSLQSLDEVFRMTFSYTIGIYPLVLERYRRGELDAFKVKYSTEWRRTIHSIPKVTKKDGTFTISPDNLMSSRPSSSLVMPMSSKFCFVSAAFRSNRASCSHDALRSLSFADKCVTKQELGHEGARRD